jgi:hypothetical protein
MHEALEEEASHGKAQSGDRRTKIYTETYEMLAICRLQTFVGQSKMLVPCLATVDEVGFQSSSMRS